MEYRISVIMGIYNCAPTLAEALDSLIAQTYQNFKVIMCDDGSKDSTVDVAQSYVERYPQKFILIRNERNMKLAASLNNCLQYADTEYVARMDGDDTCAPERFEILINFLDSHPEYSHVSTSMKLFDEDGFYGQTKPMPEIPDKSQFKTGTPYCHAPTMFRRSTLSAVGNYTAEARVERIEDYYLWYKIHKAGFQGYNMPQPLYFMRNDKNAFARRRIKDRLKVFFIKKEVCKGLGIKGGFFYAVMDVAKGFVPMAFVHKLKKSGII